MAERGGLLGAAAPRRPFGAALRALSPRCCCHSNLKRKRENLPAVWRRGRDCSRLRRSSSASLRTVAAGAATSKIALGDFVEPPFPYLGFESPLRRHGSKLNETVENLPAVWRRGRDSNPRWAFDPYALSRGAPSTTRPPLRFGDSRPFTERGIIPVRGSPGKAKVNRRDPPQASSIMCSEAPDRESPSSSRLIRS
jgi:hypothetical protein